MRAVQGACERSLNQFGIAANDALAPFEGRVATDPVASAQLRNAPVPALVVQSIRMRSSIRQVSSNGIGGPSLQCSGLPGGGHPGLIRRPSTRFVPRTPHPDPLPTRSRVFPTSALDSNPETSGLRGRGASSAMSDETTLATQQRRVVRHDLPNPRPRHRAYARDVAPAATRPALLLERDNPFAHPLARPVRRDRKPEVRPAGRFFGQGLVRLPRSRRGRLSSAVRRGMGMARSAAARRRPRRKIRLVQGRKRARASALEAAWAAHGSPTSTRVFLPALLGEPRIAFFGVERNGEIAAGCAANRSQGDVVGFSNFFAADHDRDRLRAEAVATVAAFAPGSPIVGYDATPNSACYPRLPPVGLRCG